MLYQPPRKTALPLAAVLLLHVLLGLLLIQQRQLPQSTHRRSEVRLIALKPPPPPPPAPAQTTTRVQAAAMPRPATVPVPEFSSAQAAPGAITLPAAAASAAEAAPARPLDLNLPKGWQPSQGLSPAQQAVQDPRANSPRDSAEERMARAIANEPVTIQLAGGGTMTRWPDGRCTRSLPNRSNQLVPMDAHLQVGVGHGGSCFNDKPGAAIRHTRPR